MTTLENELRDYVRNVILQNRAAPISLSAESVNTEFSLLQWLHTQSRTSVLVDILAVLNWYRIPHSDTTVEESLGNTRLFTILQSLVDEGVSGIAIHHILEEEMSQASKTHFVL